MFLKAFCLFVYYFLNTCHPLLNFLWNWLYGKLTLVCYQDRNQQHFIIIAFLIFFFPHPSVSSGIPGSWAGKESTCNAGDLHSIPKLGRSPGEGNGYPLHYSGLENSMDCIVHGVAKSLTWLSDFQFTLVSSLSYYNSKFLPWTLIHNIAFAF